jgi:hypothetical protein
VSDIRREGMTKKKQVAIQLDTNTFQITLTRVHTVRFLVTVEPDVIANIPNEQICPTVATRLSEVGYADLDQIAEAVETNLIETGGLNTELSPVGAAFEIERCVPHAPGVAANQFHVALTKDKWEIIGD